MRPLVAMIHNSDVAASFHYSVCLGRCVWLKAIFGLLQALSNLPDYRRVSKLLDTKLYPMFIVFVFPILLPFYPSLRHSLLTIHRFTICYRQEHGFQEFQPQTSMSKVLVPTLASLRRCTSQQALVHQQPCLIIIQHRHQLAAPIASLPSSPPTRAAVTRSYFPDAWALQKPASGYIQS